MENQSPLMLGQLPLIDNEINVALSPYLCFYSKNGCKCCFYSLEECFAHARVCRFAAFNKCFRSECERQGANHYANPIDLLEHAEREHGLFTEYSRDSRSLNVVLPLDFLYPKNYSVMFLRRFVYFIDGKTIVIGIAIISQEASKEGLPPRIMLVPIQMNEENSENNHMFQLILQVSGANNEPLEHMNIAAFVSGQKPNLIEKTVTVTAFRSIQHFFRNVNTEPTACFSSNDIWRLGIKEGQRGVVTITITTLPYMLRCVSKVINNSLPMVRYMSDWAQMQLPPAVKETMAEAKETHPWLVTRIIHPQVRAGLNVMVETKFGQACLNSIMTSITCGILSNNGDSTSGPPRCHALIIMQSAIASEAAARQWDQRLHPVNLSVFHMSGVNVDTLDRFKKHGGHVVIMTPRTLALLMNLGTLEHWNLLSNNLAFLYVHQPSRFLKSFDSIAAFLQRLGTMNQTVRKICFDHAIPEQMETAITQCIMQEGSLKLSIGQHYKKMIANCACFQKGKRDKLLRAMQVCKIINNSKQKPRRWLIGYNHGEVFDDTSFPVILKKTLQDEFGPQRLTVFTSNEERMESNDSFFNSFIENPDGILLATSFVLDYEFIADSVQGVILYDVPLQDADFARYVLLNNKKIVDKNLHYPIFVLYTTN